MHRDAEVGPQDFWVTLYFNRRNKLRFNVAMTWAEARAIAEYLRGHAGVKKVRGPMYFWLIVPTLIVQVNDPVWTIQDEAGSPFHVLRAGKL